MVLAFDTANTRLELGLRDGVAVFDPTTLKIAAGLFADTGREVSADRRLAPQASSALSSLAEISVDPLRIQVTIDTGTLKWSDSLKPEAEEFEAYDESERYGVRLGALPVHFTEGVAVTTTRMKLPGSKDKEVDVWFAELGEEPEHLDAFDLLDHTAQFRAEYRRAAAVGLEPMIVTVPAQELHYKCSMDEVLTHNNLTPVSITQKAAVALNEEGVRAIAQTMIVTGVPDFSALPEYYEFGRRGPVMVWFTEEGFPLPFCIAYTTAEAWLEPDAQINLDKLSLL